MTDIYEERISSTVTEALFVVLTIIFLSLFTWRVLASEFKILTVLFLIFFLFFLFYSLNYRTLIIRLTEQSLILKFGIFTWVIPFDNIESYALDETLINRIGGAGIHFVLLEKRYRANFNFLEYPRILVRFKRRQSLVWDISFSTRQPEAVMQLLQENLLERTDR